jgi:hypothetical protein
MSLVVHLVGCNHTYRKGAPDNAYVDHDAEYLYIRLQQNGQILAKHKIAEGSGPVISDPSHRKRAHSTMFLFSFRSYKAST